MPLVGVAVDAAVDLEEVRLAVPLVAVALLLLPLLLLVVQRHSPKAGSRGNSELPKPPKPRWSKRKCRERAWLPWLRNLLITPDEVNSLLRLSHRSKSDFSLRLLSGPCSVSTPCYPVVLHDGYLLPRYHFHFWRQLLGSVSIHLLY